MNQLKINLAKIEEVLKKVGYSDQAIKAFREKFVKIFLQKTGTKIYQDLNEKQKKELDKLMQDKKATFQDLLNYLEKQNLKDKSKKITQQVFAKMTEKVLEKMAVLGTDKEYEIIKQALFA